MKLFIFALCLCAYQPQETLGIFWPPWWSQFTVAPTTTTTAAPSATSTAAPQPSNISPQIYVGNDVAGNATFANLVIWIGQNISGLPNVTNSDFLPINLTSGIFIGARSKRFILNPSRDVVDRMADDISAGTQAGKTIINAIRGGMSASASALSDSQITPGFFGLHKGGSDGNANADASGSGQQLSSNQDSFGMADSGQSSDSSSQNQNSQENLNDASSSLNPQSQLESNIQNGFPNLFSGMKNRLQSLPNTGFNLENLGQNMTNGQDYPRMNDFNDDSPSLNSQSPSGTPSSKTSNDNGSNEREKSSGNSTSLNSQGQPILNLRNGISTFFSSFQNRLPTLPGDNFNPVNFVQNIRQNVSQSVAGYIPQIPITFNRTNYLQTFTANMQNYVNNLANNDKDINDFIDSNSLNRSNPFQILAQLGLNGLIPNPIEALANISLHELENSVHDLINNGMNDVQHGVQGAQSMGMNLANLVPNLVSNAIKDIQNMINLSGVISCVNKNPLPFSNVLQIAGNNTAKCIAVKVEQTYDILNKTATNLQNTAAGLTELRDSLSKCTFKIVIDTGLPSLSETMARITCYAAALFNIQAESVLLPLYLGQRIAEADDLAESLKGHMIKCAATLATDIATQAFTASTAIGKCFTDNSTG